jgi:membrane protein required for colicin V production
MTGLDYAVIVVLLLSVAWGAWRGVVREVFSLAGWILAFLAANLFAGPFAEVFPAAMRAELRVLGSFLIIFVATLALATLATALLSKVVNKVGLGNLDRWLGALFGLVRGLVVLVAFAMLAGLTTLPRKPFWVNSATGYSLAETVIQLKPWLPPAFAQRLRYH